MGENSLSRSVECPCGGFTLIELVLVVSIIGILAVAALPILFTSTSDSARHAGMNATVGAIQTAISIYATSQLTQSGNLSFPAALDSAPSGSAATGRTPLFKNVLSAGVSTQWFKISDSCYVYDLIGNGIIDPNVDSYYSYNNSVGTFVRVATCS